MTLIISVTSTEMDQPRKETVRLKSIIAAERVEAFVVPGACLPEILEAWGATRLPVFRINDAIVWEGEKPPADLVRSWLHWPRTVDEAVEHVLSSFGRISDDPLAHITVGTWIRNHFGLWGANKALLASCGSEAMNADDASTLILKKAREKRESRQWKRDQA